LRRSCDISAGFDTIGRVPAPTVSDELQAWFDGDGDHTLGGLVAVFGPKSFALIFVLLLGLPALPLPTGGATHLFEVIAVLLALELIVGRREVWLPQRWRKVELAGPRQVRFTTGLINTIRRVERISKPRMRFLYERRLSNPVFGILIVVLSVAAFLAPPFTGLDTLPALGAVLLSLSVLLEDVALAIAGLAAGIAGIVLEIVLGTAAIKGLSSLF